MSFTSWVIEYLACAFLLATALLCLSWPLLRSKIPWKGRKAFPVVFTWGAILIGLYHLLLGIIRTIYVTMELFS